MGGGSVWRGRVHHNKTHNSILAKTENLDFGMGLAWKHVGMLTREVLVGGES